MTPGMSPVQGAGMPAPISIDSDLGDLLEKEAREEALEIIRDPSERVDVQGVAMFKSN